MTDENLIAKQFNTYFTEISDLNLLKRFKHLH